MPTRKIAFLLLLLALAGCAVVQDKPTAEALRGDKFASIRFVDGLYTGTPVAQAGSFYYLYHDPGSPAPIIRAMRLWNGKIRASIEDAADSAAALKELDKIDLRPFDLDKEVAETRSRLEKEAALTGNLMPIGPSNDDIKARYEITIRTKEGVFTCIEWNIGPMIDYYAPHSEKIAKLKSAVAVLSKYLAKAKDRY
jgi:hypothetical protein